MSTILRMIYLKTTHYLKISSMSNEQVVDLCVLIPSHHYVVDECCVSVNALLFEMSPTNNIEVKGVYRTIFGP